MLDNLYLILSLSAMAYGFYLLGWYRRGYIFFTEQRNYLKEHEKTIALQKDYIEKLQKHCEDYYKIVEDYQVELKFATLKIKELQENE